MLLARRALQERFSSKSREGAGGEGIEVGSHVCVLSGRHFPLFSAGDAGEVVRVDKEALNCDVLFQGAMHPVPVALRHLKLTRPPLNASATMAAALRSMSQSPSKHSSGDGSAAGSPNRRTPGLEQWEAELQSQENTGASSSSSAGPPQLAPDIGTQSRRGNLSARSAGAPSMSLACEVIAENPTADTGGWDAVAQLVTGDSFTESSSRLVEEERGPDGWPTDVQNSVSHHSEQLSCVAEWAANGGTPRNNGLAGHGLTITTDMFDDAAAHQYWPTNGGHLHVGRTLVKEVSIATPEKTCAVDEKQYLDAETFEMRIASMENRHRSQIASLQSALQEALELSKRQESRASMLEEHVASLQKQLEQHKSPGLCLEDAALAPQPHSQSQPPQQTQPHAQAQGQSQQHPEDYAQSSASASYASSTTMLAASDGCRRQVVGSPARVLTNTVSPGPAARRGSPTHGEQHLQPQVLPQQQLQSQHNQQLQLVPQQLSFTGASAGSATSSTTVALAATPPGPSVSPAGGRSGCCAAAPTVPTEPVMSGLALVAHPPATLCQVSCDGGWPWAAAAMGSNSAPGGGSRECLHGARGRQSALNCFTAASGALSARVQQHTPRLQATTPPPPAARPAAGGVPAVSLTPPQGAYGLRTVSASASTPSMAVAALPGAQVASPVIAGCTSTSVISCASEPASSRSIMRRAASPPSSKTGTRCSLMQSGNSVAVPVETRKDKLFDQIDMNADGVITREEFNIALRQTPSLLGPGPSGDAAQRVSVSGQPAAGGGLVSSTSNALSLSPETAKQQLQLRGSSHRAVTPEMPAMRRALSASAPVSRGGRGQPFLIAKPPPPGTLVRQSSQPLAGLGSGAVASGGSCSSGTSAVTCAGVMPPVVSVSTTPRSGSVTRRSSEYERLRASAMPMAQ